ncbi:expressed unknown protein [Seminavis robusta]|uniref:Myb-like domain-containing protein n=1 Tax=Seminavis robusta TaxID=568900 RepID=A0A9N8HE04_9STRA|nr:expressed unknown protein [Seminavis robusta]|eukprot:Sro280_g107020.1 n/a (432) ;mRNA; r:28990-30285
MMDQTTRSTSTSASKRPSAAAPAPPAKLHAGKWTPEEEAYVEGLMEEFRAGTLDIQEGTTLRSFLAKKLNCKPKRISKKYEGKNYDGKQLYWNSEEPMSPMERRARMAKLQMLEKKFKDCLQTIQLVKASKNMNTTTASHQAAQETAAAFRPEEVGAIAGVAAAPPRLSSPEMESFLSCRTFPPQGAQGMAGGLSDLYRSASNDHTALLLARQRRQEALGFANATRTGSPLLSTLPSLQLQHHQFQAPGGAAGSLLGPAPSSYAAARQEALLGLSLNRTSSPSALGSGLASFRPPSPSPLGPSAAQGLSNMLDMEQAAVLEQARLAAVTRNSLTGFSAAASAAQAAAYRPSLNTMLSSRRFSAGNQPAPGISQHDMMRLQQTPVRRDSSELLRLHTQLQQQQQQQDNSEQEQRKRLMEDEYLQQQKRQRFM